jgi:hypothetical protein
MEINSNIQSTSNEPLAQVEAQSEPRVHGRVSQLVKLAARLVNKLAIPVIVIAGLSSIPGADAGPLFGSLTLAACLPLIEAPPLFAACLVAAAGAYGAPTP